MSMRLEYWRAAPDEFKALMSLQLRLKAGIDARLFDLVCLRVSQINGCAFCVDLHAGEVRKAGETERRINGLVVWRETPFFSESERAALDWAERLTNVRDAGSFDSAYDALPAHFSERQIAVLTLVVSVMNAVNRLAIGCGRKPESEATSSLPSTVPAAK
jgi:AhpD family alkylhydroperoxidase